MASGIPIDCFESKWELSDNKNQSSEVQQDKMSELLQKQFLRQFVRLRWTYNRSF